jgi:hypothetical protein
MRYQDNRRERSNTAARSRDEAPRSQQPEPSALATITSGSTADPNVANQRLALAAQHFHLIAPTTSCGTLQVGCEVALSVVTIDVEEDTYAVGHGKRALHKAPLEKIAAATGISWVRVRRLDDRSHPHYCEFEAVGCYKTFDGQVIEITGHKEMDLRDGSTRCDEIIRKAKEYNEDVEKNPYVDGKRRHKRDPMDQITMERMHIVGHTETKAKLRAIRSLGLRPAYRPAALQKPFVCARVMFTGRTDDPELKKLFASKIADGFVNSTRAAYGGSPASPGLVAPPDDRIRAEVVAPPPPVGKRARPQDAPDPDDTDFDGDDDDDDDDEYVLPGGPRAGTPIREASTEDLQSWSERLRRELDDGDSRDPDGDEATWEAMLNELKRRNRG